MTEEEKEAIKYLLDIKDFGNLSSYLDLRNKQLNSLDIVLNLIKKQQKEIEKFNNVLNEYVHDEDFNWKQISDYVEEYYICKYKIRDKIKELEEYQKQHKEGNWADIPIEDYDFDKINLLKELLE